MKIKVAIIAVVLLLAASSLGMAVETWTTVGTPNTQNKVTATIHYVDITGKKIIRNFIGTLNNFEIQRDSSNHQLIWIFSRTAFGTYSGMKINVSAIGSGLGVPTGTTTFLATGADPNLYNNVSSIPLTLQLSPNIYMDSGDVKSVLVKGAYSINNVLNSCSPVLHLYVTGLLNVNGSKYPGFITLSTGARNLPSAPGVYSNISSNMTPGPPPLSNGSITANDFSINIPFGNSTTFNVIKHSGAQDSKGNSANLSVGIKSGPWNGTYTLASQDITYKPHPGFSGTDIMYFLLTNDMNDSPVHSIKINVGPAPVAVNAGLDGTLIVEKNSTTPLSIDLGNYLTGWNKNLTYQYHTTNLLQGTLSKIDPNPATQHYHIGYTPMSGFGGIDDFTYNVTATNGWASAPGTVAVRVLPIAFDDHSTVIENTSTTLHLLANDESFGTKKILNVYSSIVVSGVHTNGGNIINNFTSVTYTPPTFTSSTGTVRFAYTMEDSYGQTSTASVTVHTAK
ncbi:MAG: Ig-like domain-containing protein [Nitrospirota bacterium]